MEMRASVKMESGERDSSPALPGLAAATGLAGAVASCSCCVLPLTLFGLGASGAWIGNMAALAPYQPVFAILTLGSLGFGYYRTYRKPVACAPGEACLRPLPGMLIKTTLWVATALAAIAFAFPYAAPWFLNN